MKDSTSTDIWSSNTDTDNHGFNYRKDKNMNINEQTVNYTANLDVECFPQQDRQLINNNGTDIPSFDKLSWIYLHNRQKYEQI